MDRMLIGFQLILIHASIINEGSGYPVCQQSNNISKLDMPKHI